MKRNKSIGYILAVFLGALGAHLFYYQRYIRGSVYALISIFINPLIPVMILIGWVDIFFISRWNKEINDNPKNQKSFIKMIKDLDSTKNNAHDISKKNNKFKLEDKTKLIHKNSFYIEENNILEEYSHLITPQYILNNISKNKESNKLKYSEDFNIRISYQSSGQNFFDDSIKYKEKYYQNAREIPLMEYWPTFSSLNKNQLKWYLYWRKEALNKRYIDVDLSYIILFVYELLNYSFNKNAAFNISVMINLYENYKEREPKINNYLPMWISDMLFELEEEDLAKKWDYKETSIPKLYRALEEDLALNKISMTTWRKYLKGHRETAYFTENRTKVYNVFKNGINALEENKNLLIEQWFKKVDSRKIRNLFISAVMYRDVESIHIHIVNILPTDLAYESITAMIKHSENISRKQNKVKYQVKVDNEALPIIFKEHLENHYLIENKQTNKILKDNKDERFSIVTQDESIQGTSIPTQTDQLKNEKEEVNQSYKFDNDLIISISKEMDEVVGLFENEGETSSKKSEEINYMNSGETLSYSSESIAFIDFEEDNEDIDSLIKSFNEMEIKFILHFKDIKIKDLATMQEFISEQGVMLNVFLSSINEKSNKYLGEIMFLTDDEIIEFDEEFDKVFNYLEEMIVSED